MYVLMYGLSIALEAMAYYAALALALWLVYRVSLFVCFDVPHIVRRAWRR